MKKMMMLWVLVLGSTWVTGCHQEVDDALDFVPGRAHYDLTLQNDTQEEIEIYLQGLAGEDFERRGVLGPGDIMIIQLRVDFTYVVRATTIGAAPHDYFYQERVTRSSPLDLTLVIRD